MTYAGFLSRLHNPLSSSLTYFILYKNAKSEKLYSFAVVSSVER